MNEEMISLECCKCGKDFKADDSFPEKEICDYCEEKNWRTCDACLREFEVEECDPYQRICDGCEGAAEDYREQREELARECANATFIDVEDR